MRAYVLGSIGNCNLFDDEIEISILTLDDYAALFGRSEMEVSDFVSLASLSLSVFTYISYRRNSKNDVRLFEVRTLRARVDARVETIDAIEIELESIHRAKTSPQGGLKDSVATLIKQLQAALGPLAMALGGMNDSQFVSGKTWCDSVDVFADMVDTRLLAILGAPDDGSERSELGKLLVDMKSFRSSIRTAIDSEMVRT